MKIEFLTRGYYTTTAVTNAVDSLLTELSTNFPELVLTFEEGEGPFQTWKVENTDMTAIALKRAINNILNDFTGDDDAPWWCNGHHPRSIRRYRIARTRVMP